MATYHGVVSDFAAAEERHDFAAEYRFRTQLDRILTAPMIGTIYQERADSRPASRRPRRTTTPTTGP